MIHNTTTSKTKNTTQYVWTPLYRKHSNIVLMERVVNNGHANVCSRNMTNKIGIKFLFSYKIMYFILCGCLQTFVTSSRTRYDILLQIKKRRNIRDIFKRQIIFYTNIIFKSYTNVDNTTLTRSVIFTFPCLL